jgi:hypothetical protein
VQGHQTVERHGVSERQRNLSGRALQKGIIRGTAADSGTAVDLSDGGMFAIPTLRTRLRVPRYWGRQPPLPGGGNLFGCWLLRAGHMWVRLHLRQSRRWQDRLRLGGGMSNGAMYIRHCVRTRLHLRGCWRRRPVCIDSPVACGRLSGWDNRLQRTIASAP